MLIFISKRANMINTERFKNAFINRLAYRCKMCKNVTWNYYYYLIFALACTFKNVTQVM